MAAGTPRRSATNATPAVGRTPRSTTSAPSDAMPAESAACSIGLERRVSRPTTNAGAPSGRPAEGRRQLSGELDVGDPAHPVGAEARTPQREIALALGVLGSLAGLLQPVFLGLLLPRVAREEAGTLECPAQLGVERAQAAGDAEPQRSGLPRHPAAVDRRVDVVGVRLARHPERLGHDHPVRGRREVLLDRTAVHRDGTLAGPEPDARDGLLAAAGGLGERRWHRQPALLADASSRGSGACASWGWSGRSEEHTSELQ